MLLLDTPAIEGSATDNKMYIFFNWDCGLYDVCIYAACIYVMYGWMYLRVITYSIRMRQFVVYIPEIDRVESLNHTFLQKP